MKLPSMPARTIAKAVLAAGLMFGATGLSGCSTNPATGGEVFSLLSPEDERKLGAEEHPKVMAQFGGAYPDDSVQAYVAGIGSALVANSEQAGQAFTFTVLDSPVVNAFALPGGYVYVTRGLMALADSEAELAGVIGHEIGHVTARHGAQQHGRSVIVGLGAAILGAAIGSGGAADLVNLGGGLVLRQYSREQEFEADLLGLRYLTRAGYDAGAMSSFLAKLRDKSKLDAELLGSGDDPDQFSLTSTHPRTIDRVREAEVAALGSGTHDGRIEREAYLRRLDGMVYGDSAEEGYVRGQRFVHPALRFEFSVPPGYTLVNGTEAVRARGPGGAVIVFDSARHDARMSMTDYVVRRWGGQLSLVDVTRFDVNGMPAATGITRVSARSGPFDLRLVAIDGGDGRIFRFLFGTPTKDTAAQSAALRQTALSFRRISEAEAARQRPHRLRVYEARPGDTVSRLAQWMPEGPLAEARFRVLNGLAPGEEPKPGQLLKYVTF